MKHTDVKLSISDVMQSETKNLVYQENTNTKSVFGIPALNFLVFSWYVIGILNTIYVKFG